MKHKSKRRKKSSHRLPYVRKIVIDLVKDQTFLSTLILQIFLILSLGLLVGYISMFFAPSNILQDEISVVVVGSDKFSQFVNMQPGIESIPMNTEFQGFEALDTGLYSGLIMVDEQSRQSFVRLVLPENQANRYFVQTLLQEPLLKYEDHVRSLHYDVSIVPLSSFTIAGGRKPGMDIVFHLLYSLFVPIVLLVPIFLIGSMLLDMLSQEFETKTILVALSATTYKRFLSQHIIACMIVVAIELLAWMFLLDVKGVTVHNKLLLLVYALVFCAILLLFCSWIITKFKNKQQTQVTFSLIVLAVSFSGDIIPFSPIYSMTVLALGIQSLPIIAWIVPVLVMLGLLGLLHKQIQGDDQLA